MTSTAAPSRRRGRPPKSDGDYRATRELLCRAGVAALTQKGFSATGIDEILKSTGVPKGSFYNFFSSKEAFGAELIRLYAHYFARKLDRFFLDESLTPAQAARSLCEDAELGMARYEFRRGCLVGNLGQEMEALPEAFRGALTAVLEDWQARTARCLEAARQAGRRDFPGDRLCEVGNVFWIGWEGAVLRAKLERRSEPLRLFAQLFVLSLKS